MTLLPNDAPTHFRLVRGYTMWLFCRVNDFSSNMTVTVTWMRDDNIVLQNAPRLLIRRPLLISQQAVAQGSFTSLLAMEDLQSSENGRYQCIARNGMALAMSNAAEISGMCPLIYYS